MKWAKISLGEITTKIGSGATPKGGEAAYETEGISLIRSLNVYDLEFKINNLAFINDRQAKKLANVTVNRNDILLNITGASVCRCTKVPDRILPARVNQHVAIIRCNTELVDSDFLLYYLVSPRTKRLLLNIAQAGGTREALTKEDLQKFEIELPPLPIQQKIAATIAAYDDLIENNQRRIALLERMAREIYREWFVRLRFPGWEEVEGVPVGWDIVSVNELYDTSSGGTPSRKNFDFYNDGQINWLKTQELKDTFIFQSEEKITKLGLKKSAAKLFPIHTVVIALYGATIGMLGILAEPATTNQACCALLKKEGSKFSYTYIYLFLLLKREYLNRISNGAAQQNISQEVVGNLNILKPPNDIMNKFNNQTESLFSAIRNLHQQNHLLRQTRDRLLPRLLRGELL